jgi:AcrR family transcriptional regulator
MKIMEQKTPTRQRILESAIDLFSVKGYTETTIRQLAAAVGVKEAAIYNYFPSKNSILESILEDLMPMTQDYFVKDMLPSLKDNPSAEGIMACLKLVFHENEKDYFLKELFVVFQEQYRNPLMRDYVCNRIILSTEQVFRTIVDSLKEFGVLRHDTESDFWVKMHSSLIYTFASRALLGIGENSPDFSGMGMVDLLRNLYDLMLKTCKA